MTRSFFVSAIRTVYEPGCAADLMWVLVGPQGRGKTQVIKALCPEERYFGSIESEDIAGSTGDGGRKPRMLASRSWIIEIPEIKLQGRYVSAWKSFISDNRPVLRRSYARTEKCYPRRSVFIATSNPDNFLVDLTGNRRFLPITLPDMLDLEAVRAERDSLWATALTLYRENPKGWNLPESSWGAAAELQETHRERSDMEVRLENLTTGAQSWPMADVPGSYQSLTGLKPEWLSVGDNPKVMSASQLTDILKTKDMRQLSLCLKKLGWEQRKSRCFLQSGQQIRLWVHPDWRDRLGDAG